MMPRSAKEEPGEDHAGALVSRAPVCGTLPVLLPEVEVLLEVEVLGLEDGKRIILLLN